LEEAVACPNAPDVCQKTRSGGTSKPQILRGELQGIGVCQNAMVSAHRSVPRAEATP